MEVFKKKFGKNADEIHAKSILTFFKLITAQFSSGGDLSSYEHFQSLFCTLNNLWDKDVIEKGQELKRFYTI